jgi:serine/threonine-protein kinase
VTDPHQPLFPSSNEAANGNPVPIGYPQIHSVGARPPARIGGGRPPSSRQIPQSRIIAGAAVLAAVAVIVGVIAFVGSPDSQEASDTRPAGSTGQTEAFDSSEASGPWRSTSTSREAPMQNVPPPLVQAPDTYGDMCGNGFHATGRSGWATNAGRGSAETSCSFARSVLFAYWDQYNAPSIERRTVLAAGRVPCPTTGGRCVRDDFVMECAGFGSDPWITCTGGRNARVYIY